MWQPPESWHVTVVDDLRVRSEPRTSADSIKYEPLLPKTTELTVIEGPLPADGYPWYLVELEPGVLDGGITRGWVAGASREGKPWIMQKGID